MTPELSAGADFAHRRCAVAACAAGVRRAWPE
jgi:hypothetical protein